MEFLFAATEALGWGIWTAVNPCPMTTNIVAVSFLGRRVESCGQVLLGGFLYAAGRALTYAVLAILLVGGVQASGLSDFLSTRMNQILGPVLILIAMLLLELVPLRFSGPGASDKLRQRVETWGVWASLPLGALFALSFCPASAGYFFVAVFRLSAAYESSILLPAAYGLGTALPVVAFAVLIAFSARSVGRVYNVVAQVEWWTRRAAGVIFLAVGIFLSLRYCFGLF